MSEPNNHTTPQPVHESRELTIPPEAGGQRLDRWLAAQYPQRSRSEIQRWIREGLVRVDGGGAKPGQRLEAAQQVRVAAPPAAAPPTVQAEPIPLHIVYEDANVLVVDKPAGMVVHPAPGHESGTLVHAILHHCPDIAGVGGAQRPGIVHRLDKETSGLIIVAKNDRTQRALQDQFQARTVYKEYLALVEGKLKPARGRIAAPIGRHPVHRQRMAVLPQSSGGRARDAVTEYEVIGRYSTPVKSGANVANFSLVRVILHTGRTHQIRVHLAWYKHPVVGDTLYGYRRQRIALDRHFLHAHRLRLHLPGQSAESEFVASLPPALQAVLEQLAAADA
jgi:23S rRNA pseudouridine1911/1915/1917 synthase